MTRVSAFDKMSSLNPDFAVNLGDMHYAGTNKTTRTEFEFAYHEVFKSQE